MIVQKSLLHAAKPTDCLRSGSGHLSFVLCLVAVIIVGLAAGYLFESDGALSPGKGDVAVADVAGEIYDESNVARPRWADPLIHRFPLNQADVSDGIEAPALAILDSGKIALAWATTVSPTEREVMLVTSEDKGHSFSAATSVVTTGIHTSISKMRGRTVERKTRTLPHLAAHGETLILCWVDAGESRESVVMKLSESVGSLVSFSGAVSVHQSTDARPTFTSLSVGDDGTIACSWLDNRNKVQQPFAAVRRPKQAQFEPEKMVYAGPGGKGICPCCPTTAFVMDGDVLVTFRANEGGYRDMWTALLPQHGAEFQAPVPQVKPTWEFAGCPHDGPTMAKTSRGRHVAWMDAHTGTERVYVSRNESSQKPTVIGDTGFNSESQVAISQGHPQLEAYRDILYLVWDQNLPSSFRGWNATGVDQTTVLKSAVADASKAPNAMGKELAKEKHGVGTDSSRVHSSDVTGGRAIYFAKSTDGGSTFSSARAVSPRVGHFQTRPRIRISPDGRIFVAWMELSEDGKSVVVASLPKKLFVETDPVTREGR